MENEVHIPGGYVLLARKIRESGIWKLDPHFFRFWIYLLLEARWDPKPYEIGGVIVERGQVLKSFRTIIEETRWTENRRVQRWSLSRLGRMVERAVRLHMVCTKTTEVGTLFTIKNFNDYQDPGRYEMEPGTQLGTVSGQQRDNRKKEKKEKKVSLTTSLSNKPSTSDLEVMAVFDFWEGHRKEVLGNGKTRPMDRSDKRLGLIRARLKKYTVQELKDAVRGCLSSDQHRRKGQTDIELVCRDQQKVDQYLCWFADGPPDFLMDRPAKAKKADGMMRHATTDLPPPER